MVSGEARFGDGYCSQRIQYGRSHTTHHGKSAHSYDRFRLEDANMCLSNAGITRHHESDCSVAPTSTAEEIRRWGLDKLI